jgi:hypothetical protein
MVAEHIGEAEVQELCRFLGLARLPAGSQHGFGEPPGGREAAELAAVAA